MRNFSTTCISSILASLFFLAGCATVPSPDRDALDSISRDGIGERFLMSRFTAVEGGIVGKYTLRGWGVGGMTILSPKGGRSQGPIGHGSIIVIENRLNLALLVENGVESIVSFADTDDYSNKPNVVATYKIDSDTNDPLRFGALSNLGWVYLGGKGTIICSDGKSVNLP